jgi:hypothetical protein
MESNRENTQLLRAMESVCGERKDDGGGGSVVVVVVVVVVVW